MNPCPPTGPVEGCCWDFELIVGRPAVMPGKGMVSLDEVFKTLPCVTFQDIPLQIDFKRPWALPEPIFATESQEKA